MSLKFVRIFCLGNDKKCFQEFNSLKIKLRSCALSRKMRVRSSKRGCAGHIMDRELKLKWWKTSLWSQSTTLHYQSKWEAAFQEFNYANFEEEKDNARCSFGENWENSSSNVPVFIVYMRPYSGFTLLSGIYSPPIQGLCAKGKKCISKSSEIQTWEFTKIGQNMQNCNGVGWRLKTKCEMWRANEGLFNFIIYEEPFF